MNREHVIGCPALRNGVGCVCQVNQPKSPALKPGRVIYLAGPMRGRPEFNFPAFFAAAGKLRAAGHRVFNPAERDNERHRTNVGAGNLTGDEKQAERDHGFSLRDALADDMTFICKEADTIALLPGWQDSKGARAELATAEALGHEVHYL